MRLKQYKDSLEEVHPSLDASLSSKKPKRDSGTDLIIQKLDEFNNDFTDTVNTLVDRINDLNSISSKHQQLQVRLLKHVSFGLISWTRCLNALNSREILILLICTLVWVSLTLSFPLSLLITVHSGACCTHIYPDFSN